MIVEEWELRCTSRIVSVFASRVDGSLARWSEPISRIVSGAPGLGSVSCLTDTPEPFGLLLLDHFMSPSVLAPLAGDFGP